MRIYSILAPSPNVIYFTDEKSARFGDMFSECIDYGTSSKVDNITDSILKVASGNLPVQ